MTKIKFKYDNSKQNADDSEVLVMEALKTFEILKSHFLKIYNKYF